MAKAGGLLKLDAICARLKSTLQKNEPLESKRLANGKHLHDDRGLGKERSEACLNETNNNELAKAEEDSQDADMVTESVPASGKADEMESRLEEAEVRKNRRKSNRPRNLTEYTMPKKIDHEDEDEEDSGDDGAAFNLKQVTGETVAVRGSREEEIEDLNGETSKTAKDESVLDLSHPPRTSPMSHNGDNYKHTEPTGNSSYHIDDYGVMDLSVTSRSRASTGSCDSDKTADTPDPSPQKLMDNGHHPSPDKLRPDPGKWLAHVRLPHGPPTATDATSMKNYAENTMTELLSLYGFSEGEIEAQSITSNVPLQNFAPGSILDRHTGAVQKIPRPVLQPMSTPAITVPQTEPVTMATELLPGSMVTVEETKSGVVHLKEGGLEISDSRSEDQYTSILDSVSKLAKLPPGLGRVAKDGHPILASGYVPHCTLPDTLLTGAKNKTGGAATTFASSSAYVKACFDPNLGPKLVAAAASGSPGNKLLLPDYSKYVKRYSSYEECGGNHCQDMSYKEHFHCMDCSFRVFVKKEEMIRHFKWHKKRDDSLQHGFLRFSPMDDCTQKYSSCAHNGRQTHYHCLQPGCTKVYISTSDVQMHANYHRKDSAIIQEGFQRFRATEDCGTQSCSFYGQRTTHFHCRRDGCSFTFKNKADMEKHKAYHQKDELLHKDGFKKFMKYEHCNFAGCKYSKVSNHIHCIRTGCDYVLHSTGQLYSHKRKHERRDFEHAYRRFKEEQHHKGPVQAGPTFQPPPGFTKALQDLNQCKSSKKEQEYVDLEELVKMRAMSGHVSDASTDDSLGPNNFSLRSPTLSHSPVSMDSSMTSFKPASMVDDEDSLSRSAPSTLAKLAPKLGGSGLGDSLNLSIVPKLEPVSKEEDSMEEEDHKGQTEAMNSLSSMAEVIRPPSPQTAVCTSGFVPKISPPVNEKKERDESWKKYLTRYTANDPCHSRCQFLYKDHYHCNNPQCGMLFRSKDGVREHAKHHEQQDRITSLSFMMYEEGKLCTPSCKYNNGPQHYHCLWADCQEVISNEQHIFSRLEHHKIHEYARVAAGTTRKVPPMPMMQDSIRRRRGRPPKYPRTEIPLVPKIGMTEKEIADETKCFPPDHPIASGFRKFNAMEPCPDERCLYFLREHYHCVRQRCHHSTDRSDVLNLHAKDFHSYVYILEGFEFFDRHINCRRPHCHNNRANRHYHCVRPRCDYSFVRYSTMAQHDKKHRLAEMGLTPSPSIGIPNSAIMGSTATPLLPGPILLNAASSEPTDLTATSQGMVKAAGTFFPITTLSKPGQAPAPLMVAPNTVALPATGPVMLTLPPGTSMSQVIQSNAQPLNAITIAPIMSTITSSNANPSLVTIAPKPAMMVPPNMANPQGLPLTMLLQQKASLLPQLNWLTLKMKMHFGVSQNCGRPFCKLKKKDHYHCFDCNQAFSDPVRLKSHVTKHGIKLDKGEPGKMADMSAGPLIPPLSPLDPQDVQEDSMTEGEDSKDGGDLNVSSSLNLNPQTFSNMLHRGQQQRQQKQHQLDGSDSDDSDVDGHLVMDLTSKDDVGKADPENDDDDDDAEENMDLEEMMTGSPKPREDSLEMPTSPENTSGPTTPARRSGRKRTATRMKDGFIDSDEAISKIRRVSTSSRSSREGSVPKILAKEDAVGKLSMTATSELPKAVVIPMISQATSPSVKSFSDSPPVTSPPLSAKKAGQEDFGATPEGYQKYKFSDDCAYDRCAYRMNLTHFHCLRTDCGYSFCDRSRIVQHTDRHRRLDGIMEDEFQQFRPTVDCARPDCEHSKKANHFHCLKCPFICTDSSKVLAHRKHHAKMENIQAQGFIKFTGSEPCPQANCSHSGKQTHYHCTVLGCNSVAMGPAQMSSHRAKHDIKTVENTHTTDN